MRRLFPIITRDCFGKIWDIHTQQIVLPVVIRYALRYRISNKTGTIRKDLFIVQSVKKPSASLLLKKSLINIIWRRVMKKSMVLSCSIMVMVSLLLSGCNLNTASNQPAETNTDEPIAVTETSEQMSQLQSGEK